MNKLYTKASIDTKAANKEADFVAVASTAIEDRHGEIVSVEGWDVKEYKKNPVLLWAHDHAEIAVGQAKKVWVEGQGKKAKFMIEGFLHEHTERARALKQLVKDGIIKTLSVGFRPLEMDGNKYTSQELLEVSLVNVPANPQAMISAYKSLEKAGFDKDVINDVGVPVGLLDQLAEMDQRMDQFQKELETAVKGLKHLNPQGRNKEVISQRLSMLKVVARGVDTMIAAEKQQDVPRGQRLLHHKAVKRSVEKMIVNLKGDLNG